MATLDNVLIINKPNISIPATQTTVPITPIVDEYISNETSECVELQITGDNTFLSNYAIIVQLQGLNINKNSYQLSGAGSYGIEYIKTGYSVKIPAGATLKVFAYNQTATSVDGTMNVFAIFNITGD